ncbi:MAG: biotin--[acetyl-CoA-carboxylase] ligase [Rhodobacteraceae bacterium]|nr:biotin--[acetyl-CoA-carboxylase] ligase [Paracoccaceae bacterium]
MNSGTAWPEGYGRRILESVDSTLDEATRIGPGLGAPEWILARVQTKGRGRRGRAWVEPAGNFAATLVMFPEGNPGQIALRSFVASLAVLEACIGMAGRSEGFALKWPNDVLLNGGKLAGILLESTAGVLSVGIGVNLMAAPPVEQVEARALRPVSLLSEIGIAVEPEEFLTFVAAAFARYETQFNSLGFEPIRTAWLSHAARLGQVITARTGNTETTGTFQTVDATGNLVLLNGQTRVAIPAADVFF